MPLLSKMILRHGGRKYKASKTSNLIYKELIVMLNEVDNSLKVDIDNKKDEQKTIQLLFLKKTLKNSFLEERLVTASVGHSISWS